MMADMKKSAAIFGAVILIATLCALRFSQHPLIWILGLTVSIPIYAAIAGAFLKFKD